MSLPFYHLLHLAGVICLFVGFGGLLSAESVKKAMMWHGIGLVLLLISGFGAMAKLGLMSHMPVWAILMLVIWLILGGLPVLAKRHVLSRPATVTVALALGIFAAYLGYLKPW